MTVEELIGYLSDYDRNAEIVLFDQSGRPVPIDGVSGAPDELFEIAFVEIQLGDPIELKE